MNKKRPPLSSLYDIWRSQVQGVNKILCFFLKFFLNSASSAAALVFYLPCVCTQADTEENQRKAKS